VQALIEFLKIPSPLHAPLALYSIIEQQVKLARSLQDMFKTCKQLPIGVLQQRKKETFYAYDDPCNSSP
jgi:hypothetical protein